MTSPDISGQNRSVPDMNLPDADLRRLKLADPAAGDCQLVRRLARARRLLLQRAVEPAQ
jgi:hypothetical protein